MCRPLLLGNSVIIKTVSAVFVSSITLFSMPVGVFQNTDKITSILLIPILYLEFPFSYNAMYTNKTQLERLSVSVFICPDVHTEN